ncbi:MAG: [FeFe] hydrogenase H-cluster radical SAM maturase HydE [Clostridia bacterium]|nr:[FeFe] hydrogenase H-cluster radical SAM maturase HydE [Clostridia bacterium]
MKHLVDKMYDFHFLSKDEFISLIEHRDKELSDYIFKRASSVSHQIFGNKIFIRGLVEFTNYCKNDCFYCGIRKSNKNCERYHLSDEEILGCCQTGYSLGFRTFVLQGGEDGSYKTDDICRIVDSIRRKYPDCAITLSIGEKTYKEYKLFFDYGADRYLLRHETANDEHYRKLHPDNMSLENRKQCLYALKEIGYQVGTGFMVGSPFQTIENIAEDLEFIQSFSPHMVGIGPFIPHKDTIFKNEKPGSIELTLFLISILRLILPKALIPATTAVGTLDSKGREKAILAGANVLMPNLSPIGVRKKYALYDNKICTGEEAAECKSCLEKRVESIGYRIVVDRGDYGQR